MHITDLALEDFRNYASEKASFVPGLNLIVGRNAQGKTNLLEGVHCLSGLGSPRGPDSALVREGAERALLHGQVVRAQRTATIDIEIRPGRGTKALLNKTPVPRGRGLTSVVVTVFFGPDELSLVKGSPDGRRRFLDDLAVKLRPAREAVRREWERVLKQRNALLKKARAGAAIEETLGVWDDSLIRTGATLAKARLEGLGALLPYARKRFEEIAGRGTLELSYSSSWVGAEADSVVAAGSVDESWLQERLRERMDHLRRAELERGMSLVGPQRDDVIVKLSSGGSNDVLEARTFASQGDQRTAALALKLAEHDLLSEVLDEQPILLLDDVFSELDPKRRGWLATAVKAMSQTLITSAEAGPEDIAGAERVIDVVEGKLTT
ncbi:MAG: DNA replication/repair protein RecF [Actinobacteria bacterium]|nr:DNA replication/repair protein RecF [Actinomycetota bacterium]